MGDTAAFLERHRAQRERLGRLSVSVERDEELDPGELARAVADPDPRARVAAVEALGILRAATAVDAVLDALADEKAHVRRRAAWTLGRLGSPRAVAGLVRALGDRDEGVVCRSLVALGRLGEPAVAPLLTRQLEQADLARRQHALLGLRALGEGARDEPIGAYLLYEDALVPTALAAIGAAGGELRELTEITRRASRELRGAIYIVLGEFGRGEELLLAGLSGDAREAAAYGLAQLGQGRHVEDALGALVDDSWFGWVARTARDEVQRRNLRATAPTTSDEAPARPALVAALAGDDASLSRAFAAARDDDVSRVRLGLALARPLVWRWEREYADDRQPRAALDAAEAWLREPTAARRAALGTAANLRPTQGCTVEARRALQCVRHGLGLDDAQCSLTAALQVWGDGDWETYGGAPQLPPRGGARGCARWLPPADPLDEQALLAAVIAEVLPWAAGLYDPVIPA